jgi:DNA helicase-2/ATP-dependent DNA helicase PcrA
MSELLDDLDPSQREAAEAVVGPVCIIAGAGTGKTRTVTYRLAHAVRTGQLHADRALAITHSKKAATELGERLNALGVAGVDARTFHAGALRVAAQFWAITGRPGESPVVLAERDAWRLWRDSIRSVMGKDPDNATVRDVTDEVAWARSRLLGPGDYASASSSADRNPGVDPRTVTDAWHRYAHGKAALERVDFADLLDIAADVLEKDPQAARQVRTRWAHVTVDEYQDTDPAQQRLLEVIVSDNQDLCVVGDPRQAIYSWKGADPGYLTDFPRRYPSARVVNLDRNYRSSPQILKWANRTATDQATKPLVPTRPEGPSPKVHRLESESAEAPWVVGSIRRALAAGTQPAQVAVLYRYNSAQARFEAALTRAGVASRVAEDVTFFEREEIRSVLVRFGRLARADPDRNGKDLLSSVLGDAGYDPDSPPDGLGAARSRWESL